MPSASRCAQPLARHNISFFRQLQTFRPTRLCPRSATSGCEQVQQTAQLFDHLVNAPKQHDGKGETERLRGVEVDDRLDLSGLLYW